MCPFVSHTAFFTFIFMCVHMCTRRSTCRGQRTDNFGSGLTASAWWFYSWKCVLLFAVVRGWGFIFKRFLKLFMLSMWVYVVLWSPKSGTGSLRAATTGSRLWATLCKYWELNLRLLQERQALLTAKPTNPVAPTFFRVSPRREGCHRTSYVDEVVRNLAAILLS